MFLSPSNTVYSFQIYDFAANQRTHIASISVKLMALSMYSETLAIFLILKTPFLPPKARRHFLQNIDGAGLGTLVDIDISSVYLFSTGDFWHKIWKFLRTKMPLGFTIHTRRHQFY